MHFLGQAVLGLLIGLVWVIALLAVAISAAAIQSLWQAHVRRPASDEQRRAMSLVRGRMRRLARPTLLLVPAKEPAFSKLGGQPELPSDLGWPTGQAGPLAFVGQIDLASAGQLVDLPWLPQSGRLYAFYDPERHGFRDVVQVLFSDRPAAPAAMTPPPALCTFPERRVAFMRFTSAPSVDWLGVDIESLSANPAEWPEPGELVGAPPPQEVQHRIGGYPNEIQSGCMRLACECLARGLPEPNGETANPLALESASRSWRLLLQIDSDPALKMNWGDAGRLYVFVREQHARAGDFSNTVSIWQTH